MARRSASGEKIQTIIVGAGIAGLSVARGLGKRHRCLILEARDRIGGRVHTIDAMGLPLDLGAAYIHGAHASNPIRKLSRRVKATLLGPVNDAPDFLFDRDGVPFLEEQIEAIGAVFLEASAYLAKRAEMCAWMESVVECEADLQATSPLVEGLDERSRDALRFLLAMGHELQAGEDAHRLSLKGVHHGSMFPGWDFMLREGYRTIVDDLAAGVDIRLRTPVHRIRYGGDSSVIVEGEGCSWTADRVVVTVPIGVLKARLIQFEPELPPATTRALDRLAMGAVNKVFVRFDEAFWPEDFPSFSRAAGLGVPVTQWYSLAYTHNEPILVWFVGGDFSRRLESLNEQQVRALAMEELTRCFGPDLPEPFEIIRTSWSSDPWSLGSHTILPPGASPDDLAILGRPIEGRVYLAGEGTHPTMHGTTHGAWLSGSRVVDQIKAQSIET